MYKDISRPGRNDIKLVKSLHLRKNREESGLFFIEGVKLVREALQFAAKDIVFIMIDEGFYNNGENAIFVNRLLDLNIRVTVTDAKTFAMVSDASTPQGIIAVVRASEHEFRNLIKKDGRKFLVLLDCVQDPGNVGTIIRTSDAAGVDAVILTRGCADIYNPKVLRSTMGSMFHMPVCYSDDAVQTVCEMKMKGFKIVAGDLNAKGCYYEEDYRRDILLAVGNESRGISEEIKKLADALVKIPMPGRAESLNVSVATGIIIYEVVRQRHAESVENL